MRLIVGLAAGGGQDIVARLIGQWLSERLGRQFIVENRPGASGNLALEAVADAPPDGYTLALLGVNNAINASLYNKPGFEFLRDIAPVAGVMRVPLVMVVNPSFPATTVPQFIAYAKANPGTINMGSGGVGTSIHVSGELFKMMTGVDMLHVPYRGGALALNDLIGGQLQVMFDTMPSRSAHQGGHAAPARGDHGDTLVGAAGPAHGRRFPAGLRGERVVRRSARPAIRPPRSSTRSTARSTPAWPIRGSRRRLVDLGGTVTAGSPADFETFIADDAAKWAKVVRFAGIKAE